MISNKDKGGVARAKALSSERKSAIAKDGAIARWGFKATHKGNFSKDFGIDVDCYVLNDKNKTAVISQRGMGAALKLTGAGGSAFTRFSNGKNIAEYLGPELLDKISTPIVFIGSPDGPNKTKHHGYDVSILIDVCKAISRAHDDGKLSKNQLHLAKQANVLLSASAKAGIKGLVYALAGYSPEVQEVIDAFRVYVQEEAKKYEREFPPELYREWHRLYELPVPLRGKPWKLKFITIDHVYTPLAKSDGKLLQLLREAKISYGESNNKLFQFLNEVGARALSRHLGRLLEMAETSRNKDDYESKVIERFGGQPNLI